MLNAISAGYACHYSFPGLAFHQVKSQNKKGIKS